MDTTDPDITFNKNGVCNYCQFAFTQVHKRKAQVLERPWIISEINKGKCLLGLSGGVDSSYALHLLLESKIKPYTFSFDNGYNTKQANRNIKNLVKQSGVEHEYINIDLGKYHELQKAFIQSGTANIEIPTDHILMAITYRLAKKKGIKHIISGGNWQTEGVMPKVWGYEPKDLKFIKSIYGKSLKGIPTISLPQYLIYRFIKRITIINLLEYYDYNRSEAIKTLQDNYNYEPYGEKHGENLFTKWFQDCYLLQKFGYDKRKPHLSSMIHSGQMTRDEALKELGQEVRVTDVPMIALTTSSPDKKTYKDYHNHEWLWELLTKLWTHTAVLRHR